MRPQETVYLSLGAAANAASMHFWNAQQAYFDYSGRTAPVVEHDVSFRAGEGTDGLDTYTPRALLFDVRSEFGAMARINELYATEDDHGACETMHTAERVPPSEWSALGDEAPRRGRPRYWSDYASVLFHPRSQVPVAAPALYGSSFLATPDADAASPAPCSFADGVRVAQAMEGEQRVMEEQVRWLAEDSDLMQGFQVAASASDAFSGVASAYLGYLADEYPKTERHTTLIARTMPAPYGRVAAMNEVLALTHAVEHANMVVPVHLHAAAQPRACVRPVWDDMHHAAAVVATLWETATLPTRLVQRSESMATLRARLAWRGDTPIVQLGGCAPTPLLAQVAPRADVDALVDAMLAARGYAAPPAPAPPFDGRGALAAAWWDRSLAYGADTSLVLPLGVPYAETVVARDADALAEAPTMQALAAWQAEQPPWATRTFVPLAYPTARPYPAYLYGLTSSGRVLPDADTSEPAAVTSMPCVASLRASPDTLAIVERARSLVIEALEGHTLTAYGVDEGMDRDAMLELRETLERLSSAYGTDAVDTAEPGTDEEWADDAWDV
ncbi:mtDNA inheritance, partitioning of the mitochondrial organelle [Malassezia caprae]|uniref:MtDNA inheritance, partitioning of the mitochondrial organelle n=1 Tax=Malassezia caprae TaxID=1381934 RepID=A0AAF0IVX3_9BASI|nr:mtDNA inheritance, partitioning of the mitochondrial organelle [Malassezia caprae]